MTEMVADWFWTVNIFVIGALAVSFITLVLIGLLGLALKPLPLLPTPRIIGTGNLDYVAHLAISNVLLFGSGFLFKWLSGVSENYLLPWAVRELAEWASLIPFLTALIGFWWLITIAGIVVIAPFRQTPTNNGEN